MKKNEQGDGKEQVMKNDFMFQKALITTEKKQYNASIALRDSSTPESPPAEEKPKWSLYPEKEPHIPSGMHMIYEELGWIAEVEIIEDLSDETKEAYKLKVIRTIEEAGPLGIDSLEDGTIFEPSCLHEGAAYSVWRLYKEGE